MPRVSVITLTYNHERFIAECIASVLGQDFLDWELLIIDDGSPDRTAEVIGQFADPRIRYFRLEHGGIAKLGEHYNFALDAARGEVVAVLEGDDRWYDRRLAEHLAYFADSSVVMTYGCAAMVGPDAVALSESPAPEMQRALDPAGSPTGREFVRQMLLQPYSFVPTAAMMIRRDALKAVGGFWQPPYSPTADYGTFLRLGMRGRAVYVPGVVAMWRQHQQQVTSVLSLGIAAGALATAEQFVQGLSPREQQDLGVDLRRLRAARRPWLARVYWGHALAALREGRPEAVQHIKETLRLGGAFRKVEALAALAMLRAGVNPATVIQRGASFAAGRWLSQRIGGADAPRPVSGKGTRP